MGQSELFFNKYVETLQSKGNVTTRSTSFYLKKYAFLKKFIAFMPSAFYVLNYQTQKFQYISPDIKSILGFEADELQLIPYFEFLNRLHPEDFYTLSHSIFSRLVKYINNLEDSDLQNFRFSIHYRIAVKNGAYIKLLEQFIVLERDANNNPILVLGLFHDISHHKVIETVDFSILQYDLKTGYSIVNEKPAFLLKLTLREREIVALILKGETSKAIANQLSISVFTVNAHRKNMFNKLKVKNTPELLCHCIKNGLLIIGFFLFLF
jgi:DNA-binding CsgD family transcriptional regulator